MKRRTQIDGSFCLNKFQNSPKIENEVDFALFDTN